MSNPKVDHNLLFGLLALQNGIISRDALVAAFSVWQLNKSRMLDEILFEQGALSADRQAQLQQMVAWHIEIHGQDPAQSLAAVSSASSACQALKSIGDADLLASLQQVLKSVPAADPYATELEANRSATSSGLRFHSLRPHAKGGLGEVSVALDMELNREVALKEIQPRFADDKQSRERFVLEAEITGGLEHPGIVPVYALGAYPNGRPFYAMRFIKGDSLKDALEQFHKPDNRAKLSASERQFQLRKLLGRFIDVCNAIEYAHSRGVLHRDLKPGNIMLGKYGETLVVDWGLAKSGGKKETNAGEPTFHPASPLSSSGLTQPGSTIGTPAYMSPEQAAGRLDVIGPASDVYSLGATLYHLLTGYPPVVNQDVGVVLKRVQKGDFPPPRERDTSIPRVLNAICLKAMALRPEDRYANARSLADDIEHWLADEPIVAVKDTLGDRVRRFSRKHSGFVRAGLAGLVLVTVVSITAALWIDAERRENQRLIKTQQSIIGASTMALYLRRSASVVVVSPSGDYILTGSDNLVPRVWDQSEAVTYDLIDHEGSVEAAAFSRDGKFLATCSDDGTLRIWNTADRELIQTVVLSPKEEVRWLPLPPVPNERTPVGESKPWRKAFRQGLSLAFCPDGSKIACGDNLGQISIWIVVTGELFGILQSHVKEVTSVDFDEKGDRIVSGSFDRAIKIWDVNQRGELISISGPAAMRWVAFGLRGNKVHGLNDDGMLTTWNATTGEIVSNGQMADVTGIADGRSWSPFSGVICLGR